MSAVVAEDVQFRIRRARDKADQHFFKPENPNLPQSRDRAFVYTRGLPHFDSGLVDGAAWNILHQAVRKLSYNLMIQIPLGGDLKLVAISTMLQHDYLSRVRNTIKIPCPAKVCSETVAGNMAENFCAALSRDIPFSAYNSDPQIAECVANLLADFKCQFCGLTPGTIFRFGCPSDLEGMYVSQFLYYDIPFNHITVPQKYRSYVAGVDFLTNFTDWIQAERGISFPAGAQEPAAYIRTGRNLATLLDTDYLYLYFQNAVRILVDTLGATPSKGFAAYSFEEQPITLGKTFLTELVALAAFISSKSCVTLHWLSLGIQPQEIGFLVNTEKTNPGTYCIDPKLLDSPILAEIFAKFGSYFLPTAFANGAPLHPSYPSAQATVCGCCVTVIKAFLDLKGMQMPVFEPTVDGSALVPKGLNASVKDELNKLAACLATGSIFAATHLRQDLIGVQYGECLAHSLLSEIVQAFEQPVTLKYRTICGEKVCIRNTPSFR